MSIAHGIKAIRADGQRAFEQSPTEWTKEEWQFFFDLVDDITNMNKPTFKHKLALVMSHAEELEQDGALKEFAAWFDSDEED